MVVVHWVIYFLERRRLAIQGQKPGTFDRTQMWGSLLSLAIYGLVALSAANLWGWGLWLLAAMCVWLLLSGSFEAWWLLEPKGISATEPAGQSADSSSPDGDSMRN
jgi:hypothetical protein